MKAHDNNLLELINELEAAFQKKPGTALASRSSRKQMSADVIEQFDYPASDKQVAANRYIMELTAGKGRPRQGAEPGLPDLDVREHRARLDKLGRRHNRQHSRAVLRDLLGLGEDRFYQLSAAGVGDRGLT